ncbi:MAG: DUF4214 domain-containing protein [Pseudomonadota bacterium]
METVYLIDATQLLSVNDGEQNFILDPVTLRFTTTETGIFGGDENSANEDLPGTLQNNGTGEVLQASNGSFLRLTYDQGGAAVTSVIAVFDFEDEFGNEQDLGFFVDVEGASLDLASGTDLNTFLASNNGTFEFAPEGFRAGDFIEFADVDGMRALGANFGGLSTEEARTVAYLYEANFDRVPDLDGLNFWIDAREDGLSEVEVSQFFVDSQEFEDRFGDPDTLANQQYIETLYDNVLNRPGDTDGVAFWTGLLDEGRDRAQLLLDFVESNENADALQYVLGLDEVSAGEWAFL